MGLLDKFKKNKDKITDIATENAGKISDAVDKATDVIDDKTKGKYSDKLKKVDDAVDKFADRADDGADGDTTPPTET